MKNYQSEYDRIRNALSNSALPFQITEGVKAELEQMGVNIYIYIILYHILFYTDIYIYIMNNSITDYHRKPTHDELIQEAIIHPAETIKYPTRIATQLRNTPQLTRFDDENVLDVNGLNSNGMKQNIHQTAVQKAMQPVANYVKKGLEHFDICIYIYI